MIHVLIVDDQALMRAGIRDILSSDARFTLAEASDGFSAIDRLGREPFDVVLLDIRMPGIDGVETTRRIRKAHGTVEGPRILVLTTFEHDDNVIQAIAAGADGFIGKGIEPTALITAVADVHAGRSSLSSVAAGALVKHVADAGPAAPVDRDARARFLHLTSREREIVVTMARGATTEDIAAAEHISRYTVKTHISRAMIKTGAADRTQLIALAHRAGIVD